MEPYIQITLLNDFIFCPRSIYFHGLYSGYRQAMYHVVSQTVGKIKHENIENQTYSTSKNFLQGMEVYSDRYGLCGKIDIYDKKQHALIERKNKIKQIYDGYRYQLYGQYFCMCDMGYEVNALFLHSLSDNKRFPISLPDEKTTKEFETLVKNVRHYDLHASGFTQNPQKCAQCIYRELCDFCAFHE